MARFFTADPHFGHANIISFCNRPFPNVTEMNNTLKNNWNSVVSAEDDVYIMGDFAWGNQSQVRGYAKKLNGRKHLILGNHDNMPWGDYIDAGFSTVQRFAFISFPKIGAVGLAHDPSNCIVDLGSPWIVGHLHQQFEKMNNAVNAGVDVRNFTPVSEEDMYKLLEVTVKYHMNGPTVEAQKEFGPAHGLPQH